jgi:hypothetical protein
MRSGGQARKVGESFVWQGLGQALAFLAGIAIVNYCERDQYAYYILGIGVATAIATIAGSGASSVLLSLGGPLDVDSRDFRVVVQGGFRQVTRIATRTSLAGVPLTIWLSSRVGAAPLDASLIGLATAVAAWLLAVSSIQGVALQLLRRVRFLQAVGATAALTRLLACLALGVVGILDGFTALLISVGSAFISFRLARRVLHRQSRSSSVTDPVTSSVYRTRFRAFLPNNLYAALQGQILVLIYGVIGLQDNLAGIGAANRYTQLFSVFGLVFSMIAVPHFARLRTRDELVHFMPRVLVAYLAANLGVVTIVVMFRDQFAALLGTEYRDLGVVISIVMVGQAAATVSQAVSRLNQARGWVWRPWLDIPAGFGWTLILLLAVDLRSLENAALVPALAFFPALALHLYRSFRGFSRIEG